MPAKSTSPEAAQRKIWTKEIRQLEGDKRRAESAARKEIARIDREIRKLEKQRAKVLAVKNGDTASLTRRIGILHGRVGTEGFQTPNA